MKKIFLLIATILVINAINAQDETVVIKDKNVVQRTINASFSAISVSGAIDVYLSQSDEEVVAVSASEPRYRDRIVTEVNDGVLRIYYNDKGLQFSSGNKKLKAYVSFINLASIKASGSSDVYANGVIKGETLKLTLSGSSDFKGAVDVYDLKLDQSGSSDSNISGRAEKATIDVSGASDVKGYDLEVNYCQANASGASDIQITVHKEITAVASGASDIYYKGSPSAKTVKSSGASSVSRRN
ncbi:MAG: DUF2807 domain-containing protein [Chitinophagaceae bacterium]|nr:DUF2807 domain-containing protein [Chitinophagaceae bacterium]MCW5928370.1 DUF2807 domain-containing protein [Chitinophagaceae bacterium]